VARDRRRQADRRRVGEIVAIDLADIDVGDPPRYRHLDRLIELERNADGTREAVCRAYR
jgi:hypothetical protein